MATYGDTVVLVRPDLSGQPKVARTVTYRLHGSNRKLTRAGISTAGASAMVRRTNRMARAGAISTVVSPIGGVAYYKTAQSFENRRIRRKLGPNARLSADVVKYNRKGKMTKARNVGLGGASRKRSGSGGRKIQARDSRGRFK